VVVLVHAHVGAVHQFHHLDVDAPGHHPVFAPDLLAFLGGAAHVVDLALLLAELRQDLGAQLFGDVGGRAGFGLVAFTHGDGDIPIPGYPAQFGHVLDLVALGPAVGHFDEQLGHAPGVVAVGRGAGGHHAGEVPGHDGLGGGAAQAHALLLLFAGLAFLLLGGRHPAGPLGADAAAGPFNADGARLHGLGPVPNGLDAFGLGLLDQLLGRGVHG
jgi:hypothetical protein